MCQFDDLFLVITDIIKVFQVNKLFFWASKKLRYICTPFWAISSVGSEHLVYTEGVGGSNPSLPTL